MSLFRRPAVLLVRVVARELTGIRQQLAIQNTLLSRLADRIAPILPEADLKTVAAQTGVDYDDAADQFLIQEFVAQHYNATGYQPTDEEILEYLADEKTRDLHTRLIERDRALKRQRREAAS